jgi:hypothetical protein
MSDGLAEKCGQIRECLENPVYAEMYGKMRDEIVNLLEEMDRQHATARPMGMRKWMMTINAQPVRTPNRSQT